MKILIDAAAWKSAVNHIKRAMSKNPYRPILEYVKYEFDGRESLQLIAMNDSVLNTATIPVHCEEPSEPIEFIAHIPSIGSAERLDISISGEQISFTTGNVTVSEPRISDEYPSWRKLIPDNRETPQVYLNSTKLRQVIDGLPKDTIIGLNVDSKDKVVLLGAGNFFSLIAPVKSEETIRY